MTVLLAPTTLTVQTGTTFYPGNSGAAMPAGLSSVTAHIDTAQMTVSNSLTLHWQVQYAGDPTWYEIEQSGPISGGTQPIRGNPGNTVVSDTVNIPQDAPPNQYPAQYRFQVDNSPKPSKLIVSLDAA